jgi:alpha-glucosidase
MLISSLLRRPSLRLNALALCAGAALFGVHGTVSAQTLARPGWQGSGMMAEAWWRNAVMYRVNVRSFQDSDGDGIGDLKGVANRMNYLQSLGVDAIVLDKLGDGDGFDDVVSAAAPRQIRVLVVVDDGGNVTPNTDDAVVAQARRWLTRGAAGVLLRSTQSANDAAGLLRRLRGVTDSFPGSRVLLAATGTNPAPSTIHAINLDETPVAAPIRGVVGGPQLTQVPLELTNATAKTIRAALNGVNAAPAGTALFLAEQLYSTKELLAPANVAALDGRRRAFAMVLLASRGAASLRYGQEIGMLPVEAGEGAGVMQWTPANVTQAPKPVEEAKPAPVVDTTPAKVDADGYTTFKPYVPPPRPAPVVKTADGEVVPAPVVVDPNTLPGFTNGKLPQPAPADAATLNVAKEEGDAGSLLQLYRRLIQLHHDNPTLRNGAEVLLDYDDLGAVVWVRQPAKDSRSTAIIAVCNLSGAPLKLSLNQELTRQKIKTGTLRNLLSATATADSVQSTDTLSLPPYGVFLGELYH